MRPQKFALVALFLSVALLVALMGQASSQEDKPQAQSMELGLAPLSPLLTVVNIPARGVLCGATGWMASILMVASAGRRYADAAQMIEEGCSGPWIITPEMLDKGRQAQKEATGSQSSAEPRP